jgi:hypothetical protein
MSEPRDPHGSPGSHPHADQPNWRPADNIKDYLRNCDEGLEQLSERRFAKLMSVSRAELWRWRLMAELPDNLFEALLRASKKPTSTQLAKVALALTGEKSADVECCPHCGKPIRVRQRIPRALQRVIDDWRSKGAAS